MLAGLDLAASSSAPYWLGWLPRELLAPLAASGLYTLLLFLPVWGSVRLAERDRSRGGASLPWVLGLALGIGSLSLWELTGLFTDVWAPAAQHVIGLGLLVAFPLLLLCAGPSRSMRRTLAALLVAATAAALAVLQGGAVALAFGDLGRASLWLLCVAWGAMVLVAGGALCLAGPRAGAGRRSGPVLATCALAGVVLPLGAPRLHAALTVSPERAGPSALIITADALRAGSLSLYGGPVQTPALEAMAREGVLFSRAYSLSPWTMPSIAGLFSSKYPPGVTPGATPQQVAEESVLHAKLDDYWLEGGRANLFEGLRNRGYATAAYVGNYIVTNHEWLLRGAEDVIAPRYDESERRGPLRSQPRLHDLLARLRPELAPRREVDTTRVLTERALAFLGRNRDRSFLLWLHYYDPHAPLDPPARYRTLTGTFEVFPPPESEGQGILDRLKLGQEQLPYILSLYEAEIRYLDDAIARLHEALRRRGHGPDHDPDQHPYQHSYRHPDTFVFFTSDHGEEFMEHSGLIGHGHTFFEELVAVPFIATGPDIAPGVIDQPISAIDFLPTLEELLGVPPGRGLHGRSLAPSLLAGGAPPAPRPAFMQTNSTFVFSESQRAVVRGAHKLIHAQVSDQLELYDLAADPEERSDLAARQPQLAAELKALLEQWALGFPSSYTTMRPLFEPEFEGGELDEGIEQLKAIGYLE
ncbi:MAG: sulfatase [Deltaproteobacteria bacterium]|nr:sulfatase [Deltaproteobacteria bacterium]